MGIERVGTYRSEVCNVITYIAVHFISDHSQTSVIKRENVDEDILVLGSGARAIELDIMVPIDSSKSPKVHQPALNHIGLWIDDLPAAVSYLEHNGVQMTPGGIRKGASGHDVAFVHPRSAVGVLVELVQAPSDVIAEFK